MRILDIPRDGRNRQIQLHIKRDKPSSYARRRAVRPYSVEMQRARGSEDGPTPEQLAFGKWVKDVVDAYADPPRKWSLSRLAREAGVHRNNLYSWMNAKTYPQAETVRQFCEGLNLEYSEPARILGWSDQEVQPAPKDLPGFIDRAQRLADHPRTSPERRRALLSQIKVARSALTAARDMERTAEDLLRQELENEDADT